MKDPNGVYIVIVLLIVILVGSNLVMFGIARAARGAKFNWFKDMTKPLDQSWGKDEKNLKELSQKVQEIRKKNRDLDEED